MTEADRGDTLVKKGRLVERISDLQPRKLYILHIYEFDPEERRQIVRSELFYLKGRKGRLVSPEGLISVEKVDEDGKREPSFYRLSDFGMDIERSADPKKSFDVDLSGNLSWANWVEEVPMAKSAPKKP